jgi:N-acetylmuramoyl-L-alanine amidase
VGRDLEIANDLRAAGLRVVECDGWQDRGSSDFNPRGSVNHHTAGSANGTCPSLNGVIHGHSGSASGPLANVLQSREPDGNDIFYVVAAGRANHAGEGGWKGLSGNSSVYGLEIEHTGVDPLPEGRQKLAARFHAALARGLYSESMVCQHREWAPNRKIDAAEGVDPNRFRAWVAEYIKNPVGGTESTVDPRLGQDMFAVRDTDGGIYLAGPGVWEHLSGEEWSAISRFLPPLASNVNAKQRDLIKTLMLSAGKNIAPKVWDHSIPTVDDPDKASPAGSYQRWTNKYVTDIHAKVVGDVKRS